MTGQATVRAARPFPLFMAPPPLVFAAAFGVGVLVDRIVPLHPAARVAGAGLAGEVLLAAGVALGLCLAATFLFRRTTLNPFADPSVFVARGLYRVCRNPMYLSLVIAYLGGALMYGSPWPLVTLIAPVTLLARVVIPHEEARMAAAFGDSYRVYSARVRRWL